MQANKQAPLKLELSTDWDKMAEVYEKASEYFSACGMTEEQIVTYTMVVCELVENGMKYGQDKPGTSGKLSVLAELKNRTVTIQVSHKVSDTTRQHLPDLDRTIQWVRGFQDPFEAFCERMKEISREPLALTRSGLGIVRVAYEGRAALDFILGDDENLSVLAVSRL